MELTWQLTLGLEEDTWLDLVAMLDQVIEHTAGLATRYRDPRARAGWVAAMVARRGALELMSQQRLTADEGGGGDGPRRCECAPIDLEVKQALGGGG